MKTNEAPEKIYISYEGYGCFNDDSSTERTNNSQIEYTRTDAFIDKAWDWIEDNYLSSNQRDKSCLYCEKFKKYMKGE